MSWIDAIEIVGLCRECGKAAHFRCDLCGKAVCAVHYDRKTRICAACMRGKRI